MWLPVFLPVYKSAFPLGEWVCGSGAPFGGSVFREMREGQRKPLPAFALFQVATAQNYLLCIPQQHIFRAACLNFHSDIVEWRTLLPSAVSWGWWIIWEELVRFRRRDGYQELSFAYIKLETIIAHSIRNLQDTVGYMNWKFREVWAGDICLEHISILMIFKAMRPDELTKEGSKALVVESLGPDFCSAGSVTNSLLYLSVCGPGQTHMLKC